MSPHDLPENFSPLTANQAMQFACHPQVACFTQCCRELDLALTPYDVLRLKRRLGLDSGQLLDRYVIMEWEASQVLPTCYLTMVDDGRASCVFVTEQGCSVYEDRPGSCRAYPVGRGATLTPDGGVEESFVIVQEAHCCGFGEPCRQTVATYLQAQGLGPYNHGNDALLPLVQHPRLLDRSFCPTRQQLDQYMLALYDLDQFRLEMNTGRIALQRPLSPAQLSGLTGDDEQLLLLGIRWLLQEWFGQ